MSLSKHLKFFCLERVSAGRAIKTSPKSSSPISSQFEFFIWIDIDILEFNSKEQSIALDALYDIVATGDLPLPLDAEELVAATVLIVDEERDFGDLKWSLLSNTFFIFGGFCEVVSSVWDWQINGDDSTQFLLSLHKYIVILGPLVYCLNSVVDTLRALRMERREERHHQFDELKIELVAPEEDAKLVKQGKKRKIKLKLPFEPHNVWRRLRRHIGNRRALSAAISFGIGATCEFLSASLDRVGTSAGIEETAFIDAMSVTAYFLSAVFALSGGQDDTRKHKVWSSVWNDASRLEGLGDTFFGVASTVDVAICFLHLDDNVLWWAVISASLWQLDAFFYLRSDIISLTLYKANRPLSSGNDTSMHSQISSLDETPLVSASSSAASLNVPKYESIGSEARRNLASRSMIRDETIL